MSNFKEDFEIIRMLGEPALLEQLAEECSELAQAALKLARLERGENPIPKTEEEWNDGKKDHIYCLGWVDPMTDDPLLKCFACPDFVDKAQDDLETFYGRANNDSN